MLCLLQEHLITMNTSIHTQAAIRTLSQAFAPLNCMIHAARKGSFSFTLVNEHGIARHSERLYPEQYESAEPLQAVIDRTRQALVACWSSETQEALPVGGAFLCLKFSDRRARPALCKARIHWPNPNHRKRFNPHGLIPKRHMGYAKPPQSI